MRMRKQQTFQAIVLNLIAIQKIGRSTWHVVGLSSSRLMGRSQELVENTRLEWACLDLAAWGLVI